jgi:hypothetical protein
MYKDDIFSKVMERYLKASRSRTVPMYTYCASYKLDHAF